MTTSGRSSRMTQKTANRRLPVDNLKHRSKKSRRRLRLSN